MREHECERGLKYWCGFEQFGPRLKYDHGRP